MKSVNVLFLALFFMAPLAVGFEIEDRAIPKVCYDTLEGSQFCTTDNVGSVQVFVYNAGWCGPCNSEMSELSHLYPEFEGQPVVFASLSGEGWSRGTKPTTKFMSEWKAKHKIPFVVAGKYRDFGKAFNSPGSIPFAVVVDKAGNVAKSGFMSGSQIAARVRQLLAEDHDLED